MNWIKKQWELFKSKSLFGKVFDVLFLVIITLLIIPQGRILVQKGILKTGLFGSTKANEMQVLESKALDWKIQNVNSEIFTLSQMKGKPVFINFWATWCPPCKAEMPSIIALKDKIGDKATFVFISNESPEKVSTFLKQNGWDLPVYFPLETQPEQLEARSLPTTIVLNSALEIIHRSEGMRNWDSDDAIKMLTDY